MINVIFQDGWILKRLFFILGVMSFSQSLKGYRDERIISQKNLNDQKKINKLVTLTGLKASYFNACEKNLLNHLSLKILNGFIKNNSREIFFELNELWYVQSRNAFLRIIGEFNKTSFPIYEKLWKREDLLLFNKTLLTVQLEFERYYKIKIPLSYIKLWVRYFSDKKNGRFHQSIQGDEKQLNALITLIYVMIFIYKINIEKITVNCLNSIILQYEKNCIQEPIQSSFSKIKPDCWKELRKEIDQSLKKFVMENDPSKILMIKNIQLKKLYL